MVKEKKEDFEKDMEQVISEQENKSVVYDVIGKSIGFSMVRFPVKGNKPNVSFSKKDKFGKNGFVSWRLFENQVEQLKVCVDQAYDFLRK